MSDWWGLEQMFDLPEVRSLLTVVSVWFGAGSELTPPLKFILLMPDGVHVPPDEFNSSIRPPQLIF